MFKDMSTSKSKNVWYKGVELTSLKYDIKI